MRRALLATLAVLLVAAGTTIAETPRAKPPGKATTKAPAPPAVAECPPPPVPPAPPPPPPPPPLEETVPILGRKVVSSADEELGRVVNVLVDREGQARAAVIDFGGFLGVGSRKVAVPWSELSFRPGASERSVAVALTREQIQGAPEYREAVQKAGSAEPAKKGE